MLVIFEVSGHRVLILPADASVGPVLFGAAVLGLALTAVEQKVRRFLG
jgi:hypothetical protein